MNKIEKMIKELCPNGVEWKKIGEIATLVRGKVISKDYLQDNEGEYPVYSSQTANNGELGRIDTYMFDGKYLTWTTDGAYAGTVFKREGKFNITNVCGLIDIKDEKSISLDYVYYTLAMEAPKYVLEGMGNPKLMSNVMEKVSIPLPPHPIQTEIVRILDKFVEQQEQLERLIELRKKQYEYYREEMLKTKEGEKWERKTLGEISSKLASGSTPSGGEGSYKKTGISLIRSQNVLDFNMTFVGLAYIDDIQATKLKNVEVEENDLLLNITGDSVARVCKVDSTILPARVNQHVMIIRLNEGTFFKFVLYYLIQSKKELLQCAEANGGSRKALTKKNISDFSICLPSIEQQKEIVKTLDSFESSIASLKSALEASKKRYEYYRDKMLRF